MPRIPNPKIGFLTQTPTAADANVWDDYIADFTDALCSPSHAYTLLLPPQTGYDSASYLAGAQALMRAGADVIVTAGIVAANACYLATTPPIPKPTAVVVASAGDLSGLTGRNLTGCTNGQFDKAIVQARVNWMQAILNPTEVGVVGNYALFTTAMNDVVTALGAIPLPGRPLVGHIVDLNPANFPNLQTILTAQKGTHPNMDVLYVCSDPFLRTNGDSLVQGAHNHPSGRFSTMHEFGEWVNIHHGDRAYGPDFNKLFERAAEYVDQIINGALPANLPVFAPLPVDCVPT